MVNYFRKYNSKVLAPEALQFLEIQEISKNAIFPYSRWPNDSGKMCIFCSLVQKNLCTAVNNFRTNNKTCLALSKALSRFVKTAILLFFLAVTVTLIEALERNSYFRPTSTPQKANWYIEFEVEIKIFRKHKRYIQQWENIFGGP